VDRCHRDEDAGSQCAPGEAISGQGAEGQRDRSGQEPREADQPDGSGAPVVEAQTDIATSDVHSMTK